MRLVRNVSKGSYKAVLICRAKSQRRELSAFIQQLFSPNYSIVLPGTSFRQDGAPPDYTREV